MNQEISTIKVNLVNDPYNVIVGSSNLYSIGEAIQKLKIERSTKILVITNPDVAKPYSKKFIESIERAGFIPNLLILEAGEDQKNIETIQIIHDAAYKHNLERSSLIIALGGGVIGDMAGFAAATWLRGINFIQVPTTLLAMVDASVGGKTGVNHPKGKNLIGAFHQPKLVFIDIDTLNTLPKREFRAGMAEIIKYSLIEDKDLFYLLENTPDLSNLKAIKKELLLSIIIQSIKTKANIVEKDERENGIRAILNYGHTFGHVVETLCGYGHYLHGEAVSIGMVAAGKLSAQKKIWDKEDSEKQDSLLKKTGLPIKWPSLDINMVLESLKGDKKVKHGKLRFILPREIGKVEIFNTIDEKDIINLLEELNQEE